MKKLVALPIIAAIAVIAVYYASPLFVNVTVDEPLPTEMMEKKDTMMKEEAMSEGLMQHESSQGAAAVPEAVLAGSFVGAGDGIHNADGIAKLLAVHDDQSEHRLLRLEDFRSTNGPDLYVYLSKDAKSVSDGYVDLGRLKSNIGNQNYHIPDDADLAEYSYVLIWCKQFSVLFGYAELQAA